MNLFANKWVGMQSLMGCLIYLFNYLFFPFQIGASWHVKSHDSMSQILRVGGNFITSETFLCIHKQGFFFPLKLTIKSAIGQG